jgi:hypothetical protein
MVIESFCSLTLKNGLFPLYDSKQLTLEGFTAILSSLNNNDMLVIPERLRHAFMFKNVYNLQDYWKRQILLKQDLNRDDHKVEAFYKTQASNRVDTRFTPLKPEIHPRSKLQRNQEQRDYYSIKSNEFRIT